MAKTQNLALSGMYFSEFATPFSFGPRWRDVALSSPRQDGRYHPACSKCFISTRRKKGVMKITITFWVKSACRISYDSHHTAVKARHELKNIDASVLFKNSAVQQVMRAVM